MNVRKDQHFLIDKDAVKRIVEIVPVDNRRVLEIGPGDGILTEKLLNEGAKVTAIEIDGFLVEKLKLRFSDEIKQKKLTIIHSNAVKAEYPELDLIISNLPYSISSLVIFRLLFSEFNAAVLMVQKEFAEKMVAFTGTRDCGRLSVMVQTFANVHKCFDLPPESFLPKPRVNSSVVRITPRYPLFGINDRRVYENLVRALFMHRRKTVKNCLRGAQWLKGWDILVDSLPGEILKSRPEELYLEDFAMMSNVLSG